MKLQFLLLLLFGSAATLIPATDPRIRVVGRIVTDGTALIFDWSSVYIEVHATGPLSLLVAEGWGHGNEYHISINGSSAFQQLNTYGGSAMSKPARAPTGVLLLCVFF